MLKLFFNILLHLSTSQQADCFDFNYKISNLFQKIKTNIQANKKTPVDLYFPWVREGFLQVVMKPRSNCFKLPLIALEEGKDENRKLYLAPLRGGFACAVAAAASVRTEQHLHIKSIT